MSARDFAFQCNHCRNIDMRSRLDCIECGESLAVEAIDQYVYTHHEIRIDRLATLAHNLTVAAALCRAHNLGAVYMGHAVLKAQGARPTTEPFSPGCGKAAP